MKRIICLLLTLISVMSFLYSCDKNEAMQTKETPPFTEEPLSSTEEFLSCTEENKPDANALLDKYLEQMGYEESAVCQIGEAARYLSTSEKLAVGIVYPKTEYASINGDIHRWIAETVSDYENRGTEFTEFMAAFESFLIDDDIVSIQISATVSSPVMAQPYDLVKCFVYSVSKNARIDISHIIQQVHIENLIQRLADSAGVDEEDADLHMLDHFTLTKDTLRIYLESGIYTPASVGLKTVCFAYDDIKEFLTAEFAACIGFETESESNRIDPNKPMIALTFDDGPNEYTDDILDILGRYHAKATFFTLGNMLDYYSDAVKRIVAEGYEIGSHSWSHPNFTTLGRQELIDQITRTRKKIYDVCGVDARLLRLPYGAYNNFVQSVGAELDVVLIQWSIDSHDWETRDSFKIYHDIIDNAEDRAIILCHELYSATVNALELVIIKLKSEGYQLVTVSELMEYSGIDLQEGNVYFNAIP